MLTCDECRFDGSEWSNTALAERMAGFGRKVRAPLTRFLSGEDASALLRRRPDPATWSALEYAAHLRDVFGFYAERVERVVREDRPRLEAFGFEAACEERRYNDEEPAAVVAEVDAAASGLAELLAGLTDDQWQRIGLGSDGGERTVRRLAERAVHEGHHHLLDIGRSLRAARDR